MKNFKTVLGFELGEYFKSKGFIITTLIIMILAIGATNLPRFIDLGLNKSANEATDDGSLFQAYDKAIIICDKEGNIEKETVNLVFPKATIVTSEEEVKEAVQNQTFESGVVVTGPTSYKVYLYNSEMFSSEDTLISQILSAQILVKYAQDKGLDYTELNNNIYPQINREEIILGKDAKANYWYSYALIIVVFMMIMLYGQMIATSVATEKSNRSIEVLVTSTSPNSVLFGKVIAGAIASIFQMGLILGGALISYSFNRELWGGALDMLLNIPADVLVVFALFGLGGYLFYAFIYGAVGALVSKTEDISKSASGVMMVIMVVYFATLFQLSNIDGVVMKVLSFLPFSSYSAMFARVAMGTVSVVEIAISFVILVASVIGAGILAAKIYRMGTLRYGNPIKLSTALKDIRKKNS